MNQSDAHTQVPSGHKVGFPPFNAETFPSQLFWLVLVFVCLYILVSRFITPRMEGILSSRANKLDLDLKAAAEAQSKAEIALQTYEDTLSKARQDAHKSADAARTKASQKIDSKRDKVQSDLALKLRDAEGKITEQKNAALAQVSTIARDVTQNIVTSFTGSEAGKAELDAAFKSLKSGS